NSDNSNEKNNDENDNIPRKKMMKLLDQEGQEATIAIHHFVIHQILTLTTTFSEPMLIASKKCLELHHTKYQDEPIPLIYQPRDVHKQKCLVSISGSSEIQELVKNDIV
ncbi:10285_t:CDS:2, partial [Entrophospora sp. SA101]